MGIFSHSNLYRVFTNIMKTWDIYGGFSWSKIFFTLWNERATEQKILSQDKRQTELKSQFILLIWEVRKPPARYKSHLGDRKHKTMLLKPRSSYIFKLGQSDPSLFCEGSSSLSAVSDLYLQLAFPCSASSFLVWTLTSDRTFQVYQGSLPCNAVTGVISPATLLQSSPTILTRSYPLIYMLQLKSEFTLSHLKFPYHCQKIQLFRFEITASWLHCSYNSMWSN